MFFWPNHGGVYEEGECGEAQCREQSKKLLLLLGVSPTAAAMMEPNQDRNLNYGPSDPIG